MNFTTGYILTKAGEALHAKVEAGTTLKLTKMQLGSGTVTTVDDYYERSALVEPQNAMSIAEIQRVTAEKNMCVATAVLTNAAVDTSYMASELGLFAQNTDGTEILYAVSYDDHPSYIASKNDGTDITMKFSMYIVATSEITITLTLPKTAEEIATVAAGYAAKAAESEAKAKQLEATANNYLQTTQQAMTLANEYANISKAWAEGNASPDGVVDTDSPTGYTQSAKIWAALAKEYAGLSKFKLPIGYYNSVAEMKASETAIVGRPCVTLGYYWPNDGGGAVYIIRSKKESDVDDGGSILVLDTGNVAELIIDGPINVKQFGARADNSTACDIPFKNALAFASRAGVQLVINAGTYIMTQTLCIPTGAKIVGSTSNQVFSGFARPLLLFKFATDSMEPAIRIDSHSSTSWDTSLSGDISGVQISNLTISGDANVICGLQLRCYKCVFTNITFMGFGIGIWMSNSYLNDFNNINLFNTQIGVIADAGTNSNTTIRNCWTQWGKNQNNANVDSRIAKINPNYPKTSVGFMAMNEGGLRLYDCYTEAVNIGVYVHQSTILIKHIGLELIGKTGACFKLQTNSINKGKIVADSITEWGNYCPEVNAAYGTICDLKFDMPKSDITTTDSIIDNGAYVVIDYTDVPGYILPIKVKEDGALKNPSISNNRSRFTRHNTMILDFVLTHDGYDDSKLIVITGLNANIRGAFNQIFEIRGEQYCIANRGDSLYINNPDTSWSKNIISGSRIYVEIPLDTTAGNIHYS